MIFDCNVDLGRADFDSRSLVVIKGASPADIAFPKTHQINDKIGDFDWVLENVINKLIAAGHIGDGKSTRFDDRKLRYNKAEIKDGVVELPLGITHFHTYKANLKLTPEQSELLRRMGREMYGDDYAFFARPLGVTAILRTTDGSLVIGRRIHDDYGEFFHGVAGYVNFDMPELLSLYAEIEREMHEETGLRAINKLTTLGISYPRHTGETDVSYLVDVVVGNDYFSEGRWREKAEDIEHEELITLSTMADIERLLNEGKAPGSDRPLPIVYSTRQGLASIRPEDIRN